MFLIEFSRGLREEWLGDTTERYGKALFGRHRHYFFNVFFFFSIFRFDLYIVSFMKQFLLFLCQIPLHDMILSRQKAGRLASS